MSHVLFKGLQGFGIQLGRTTVETAFEGTADLLALLRPIEALAKGRLHVADGLTGLLRHGLAEAIHLRENAHMRGTKLTPTSHDSLLYSLVFLKPKMLLIDAKASRRSSSVTSTCFFPTFSGARSPRIDVPPA